MGAETYRDVRETDLEAMHDIATHWSVVRQLGGWPWPPNRSFTATRSRPYRGDGFVWAICEEDRLIGTVAITGTELGYFLDPRHHGRGVMSRAVHKAIQHGFEHLERDTLHATTWIDNTASHRLLTRAGFGHWQTRFERSKARRLPVLTRHYRLERTHWDSLRDRAD